MSDSGEYVSTSEDPRELLVSVQLYISTAMEITFRKVRPIHSEYTAVVRLRTARHHPQEIRFETRFCSRRQQV